MVLYVEGYCWQVNLFMPGMLYLIYNTVSAHKYCNIKNILCVWETNCASSPVLFPCTNVMQVMHISGSWVRHRLCKTDIYKTCEIFWEITVSVSSYNYVMEFCFWWCLAWICGQLSNCDSPWLYLPFYIWSNLWANYLLHGTVDMEFRKKLCWRPIFPSCHPSTQGTDKERSFTPLHQAVWWSFLKEMRFFSTIYYVTASGVQPANGNLNWHMPQLTCFLHRLLCSKC